MRIAVFAPFGVSDGISIYAESLFGEIGKLHDVTFLCSRDYAYMKTRTDLKFVPAWDKGGNSLKDILAAVSEIAPDIVHLQLHESYLQLGATAKLINTLVQGSCKVFVTAHSVKALGYDLAQIAPSLKKVELVYALSEVDAEYLQKLDVKCVYAPHPYWQFKLLDKAESKSKFGLDKYFPIIATHGLVNANKGLLETARAAALIKKNHPDFLWLPLNAVNPGQLISAQTAELLEQAIERLGISENVMWHKDFIDSNHLVVQLLALADVGILPYQDAGESASGAIRKFVAAKLPSVVSNIKQLQETGNIFSVINGVNEFAIADAVLKLLNNEEAKQKQREAMQGLVSKYSWENAALQHISGYIEALMQVH